MEEKNLKHLGMFHMQKTRGAMINACACAKVRDDRRSYHFWQPERLMWDDRQKLTATPAYAGNLIKRK